MAKPFPFSSSAFNGMQFAVAFWMGPGCNPIGWTVGFYGGLVATAVATLPGAVKSMLN